MAARARSKITPKYETKYRLKPRIGERPRRVQFPLPIVVRQMVNVQRHDLHIARRDEASIVRRVAGGRINPPIPSATEAPQHHPSNEASDPY